MLTCRINIDSMCWNRSSNDASWIFFMSDPNSARPSYETNRQTESVQKRSLQSCHALCGARTDGHLLSTSSHYLALLHKFSQGFWGVTLARFQPHQSVLQLLHAPSMSWSGLKQIIRITAQATFPYNESYMTHALCWVSVHLARQFARNSHRILTDTTTQSASLNRETPWNFDDSTIGKRSLAAPWIYFCAIQWHLAELERSTECPDPMKNKIWGIPAKRITMYLTRS